MSDPCTRTRTRARRRRASFTRAEVRRVIQAAREEGLAVEGVVVALPSGDRAGVEIRTSAYAAPAAPAPTVPAAPARSPAAPGAWD